MTTKHSYWSLLKKPKTIEVVLGGLCTLIVLCITFYRLPIINSALDQMDGRIYDQIIRLNRNDFPPSPRVILIDIDNESVQKEGRWPWPRDKMAQLVNQLKQDGVITIGLDMVMSEAELNYALGLQKKLNHLKSKPPFNTKLLEKNLLLLAPLVDNDQTFSRSLLDHNVVLGYLFHHESTIKKGALPPPVTIEINEPIDLKTLPITHFEGYNGGLEQFIQAANQAGFVTNAPDHDGTVRHSLLLANHHGKIYPSLALKTAMNYLMVDKIKLLTHHHKWYGIDLEGTFIPVNETGQILIPFWGPPGTLDYYSATDILQNKVDPKTIEGSIAIIGSSMALLADLHQSPVAQLFPGVEMVGNIVQGIVNQLLVTEYDWSSLEGGLCLALIGLIFSFIFPVFGASGKFIALIMSLLLILTSALGLFIFYKLYVPSALLLTLITLQAITNYSYAYMIERHQKKQISQLFGQYVPKDYVKELIEYPEQYSMEGQTRHMTVAFADIRGFTSISEMLDASGVKRLLNTFFTPITEIIFSHRGTIDKYVGDMIVAFWGAPMEDKEHSGHALTAALEVFRHLSEINAKMKENNLPEVNIGLGLATGLMNVGDMGSEFRRAYTVLGDTVNLASRLQDLTKFYQVDILTNDTARLENEHFLWKTIDKVAVKGRKTALTIYTPLGLKSEASEALVAEINDYHNALEKYYAQKWDEAQYQFETLVHSQPRVYVYSLYLERIHSFKITPPPEHWDGVYTHLHK